jgi:hypothetical protein
LEQTLNKKIYDAAFVITVQMKEAENKANLPYLIKKMNQNIGQNWRYIGNG